MAHKRKKPSRKYTPRNEFRYCKSYRAGGPNNPHPHYVFGEYNGDYYSLGLTSHPNPNFPYVMLSRNPNPYSKKKMAVQINPFIEPIGEYDPKPKKKWKFHKNDIPIIQRIISFFTK